MINRTPLTTNTQYPFFLFSLTSKLLNIGCGKIKIRNWFNVDINGGDIFGDIRNLPFLDSSFDYVLASHILEHILEARKAFREIHRVSKKDAIIIIRVPYGINGFFDPFHMRVFDFSTFKRFTHDDPNSLEYGKLFDILWLGITDYEIPLFLDYLMNHAKLGKAVKKILLNVGFFKRYPDNRIINPIPLTRRKEITCFLKIIK